jgi:hypothetical protein
MTKATTKTKATKADANKAAPAAAAPAAPPAVPAAKVATILGRSVCLMLSCGRIGKTRKVEMDELDVKVKNHADGEQDEQLDDEKDEMSARKKLFSKGDLRPCAKLISALKDRLSAMEVSGGLRLFGPGAKLIPTMKLEEAVALIEQHQDALHEEVERLVERMPKIKEQRKEKLGPMYNEADYPDDAEIRAGFHVTYRFVSFAQPDQLQEVSAAVAEKANAQWQAQMAEAAQDVVAGLRQSAFDVMAELADRLSQDDDGKPKVLRGTALRDLQELCDNLPALNSVAEDDRLMKIMAKVKSMSTGLTAETLRDAPVVRDMLRGVAEEAKTALAGLVTEAGGRAIFIRNRKQGKKDEA